MTRLRFPAGADIFPFCHRFDAGAGTYPGTYLIAASASSLAIRRPGSDAHRPLLLTRPPGAIRYICPHDMVVHAVALLDENLRYKPEGRGFDSRCHWNFLLTSYGPGVDLASNRNEYQEYFLGSKGGRCVELITLQPSCADYLEIWVPQTPGGSLKGCNGIASLLTWCLIKPCFYLVCMSEETCQTYFHITFSFVQ